MTELVFRPPERAFGGAEVAAMRPPERARAVVVPFPLEASVSYGHGAAKGPEAILAASPELEFFDDELWREPAREFGIATLETPPVAAPLAAAIDQVAGLVEAVLAGDRFPLVLGGEHSLTAGAARPFAERHGDLAVLHFDAHADLRDGYLGERHSHAAALRRVLDHAHVGLVSVGVRNISAEEVPFLEASRDRVHVHWGRDRKRWRVEEIVAPLAGRPIYVTFDVDGFDASVMPATGTPEPGGFFFDDACEILFAASRTGRIVGADIVELAPIPGLHACDFTAAKLAYKLISYALLR